MKNFFALLLLVVLLYSCKNNEGPPPLFLKSNEPAIEVKKAAITPVIDGNPTDPAWKNLNWIGVLNKWQGADNNLMMNYKLCWTPDALYVLVQLENSTLLPNLGNPLEQYTSEDHLNIYLDEDNSGGAYSDSYNAFEYKILPSNFTVTLDPDKQPLTANNAIRSALKKYGNTYYWELKVAAFDASYQHNKPNETVSLKTGKLVGFALAFEQVKAKESNIILGSIAIPEEYEGRIAIDAGLFGTLKLIQ
ncbi:carbohydrate binding protein with CBM9 domain [Leeuwenhoekiella aestuarii]|uniref:Carbohydrate binding protein with CBM9 domain n=1 Tax=Leeuwenhoekiella aestuarii TaxID=2249426 RepID=A0A4Q0NW23_9FLAO|nr:sugar-binding protein [Leeuwenhoekiella aestuarii]RXG15572.1 carbohydrate binding protein with CBM9 domain [Leeuwenhoekiella aestuarii]RXG17321.1 carbohydrate binding protein with CBM9 domain [Leeuwenhoekiella aestuarii]